MECNGHEGKLKTSDTIIDMGEELNGDMSKDKRCKSAFKVVLSAVRGSLLCRWQTGEDQEEKP